jgi:hypothetical protein
MVPDAVRTGLCKGASTGVVRMLAIFMGTDLRLGETSVIGERKEYGKKWIERFLGQ